MARDHIPNEAVFADIAKGMTREQSESHFVQSSIMIRAVFARATEKELRNDDDGTGADRGQQSVSGQGGESEQCRERPVGGHREAGPVCNQDDSRRPDSDGRRGQRVPLKFDADWLRQQIEKYGDDIDPPACPHGVMAGNCESCNPLSDD